MKINSNKALDYQAQGEQLRLTLSETTLDEIQAMDVSTVYIKTDAGDTVEIFAGYALASVTLDVTAGTFTAVLRRNVDENTAKVLDELTTKLTAAQAKAETLEGTVTSMQSAQADIMNALAELGDLVGGASNG